MEKMSRKEGGLGVDIPQGGFQQHCFKETHSHREKNIGKRAAVASAFDKNIFPELFKHFYSTNNVANIGLHISVGPSQYVSGGALKSRQDTMPITPVDFHPYTFERSFFQNFGSFIGRAIVNEYDFNIGMGIDNFKTSGRQTRKGCGFIVAGDDQGKSHGH